MSPTIHDVIDKMEESNQLHLYDELAPLYDYIYGKMYDYKEQASRVREYSKGDEENLLELASGTGRLIDNLSNEFEKITAVDIGKGNVEIARNRNPKSKIIEADIVEFEPEEEFDLIVIMGFSLGALKPEEINKLVTNLNSMVSEKGRILIDHISEDSNDGDFSEQFYEHPDGFEIGMRTISSVESQIREKFAMSYHVVDKDSNKEYSAAEIHEWYQYSTEEVVRKFESEGFKVNIKDGKSEAFETEGVTLQVEKRE